MAPLVQALKTGMPLKRILIFGKFFCAAVEDWMVKFLYGLFGYVVITFLIFCFKSESIATNTNESMSLDNVKIMTEFCMLFYWFSVAIMYSKIHAADGRY